EVSSGKEFATLSGHKHAILGLAFAPDGKSLVSIASSGDAEQKNEMKLWDVSALPQAGEQLAFAAEQNPASFVAFTADGQNLISAGHGGLINWDLSTGKPRAKVAVLWSSAMALSPQGNKLAVATEHNEGRDGSLKLYDVSTFKDLATEFKGISGAIRSMV